MPLLKQLVYVHRVRVISVSESIDSIRSDWDVIASVMALMHERYIKDLSANVLRGQEGALLAGFSVGDWRFGYDSVPIPGTETTRRGRASKPRMGYVIDPVTSQWVRRIFQWFVVEREPLSWIVRELNRLNAPKDHRATTPEWYHDLVVRLLSNEKYIGIWPWGEEQNVRNPETGEVRQEERPEEESSKWTREFPELRIIDDETFATAQDLLIEQAEALAASRNEKGQLCGSNSGRNGRSPKHLLSGLIVCGHCGGPFLISGKRIFCRSYRRGTCTCQTTLNRKLAEKLVLDEIGRRILDDNDWFDLVFAELRRGFDEFQSRVPDAIAQAEREFRDIDQKIQRLVDRIESGAELPEFSQRLQERRRERDEASRRLKKLQVEQQKQIDEPTEEWLREKLTQLGDTLHSTTPAAAEALGHLVGGKIVVEEIRRPGKSRHFLRGRFELHSNHVCNALGASGDDTSSEKGEISGTEVTIDFIDQEKRQHVLDQSEEAKRLYDEGLMNCEIAERLGVNRSRVTAILKAWYASRGQTMPDGRSRRETLDKKHVQPPLYQRISDRVMELFRQNLHYGEIAKELLVNISTIRSAVAFWHESRGLPVPDGRTRRKSIPKSSK